MPTSSRILFRLSRQGARCRRGAIQAPLNVQLHRDARAAESNSHPRPPSPPSCMYDVLASNDAKELDVGEAHGPALQLPSHSVYLAPSGTFFCQHKTRLVPITKAVRPHVFKAQRGKCHCSLALPRRAAKLRLGRIE